MSESCFLAPFSETPCDGQLVKAHLIPRQLIKRELTKADRIWSDEEEGKLPEPPSVYAVNDPRAWVFACGGPTGISGHHGQLDASRTLRIPRDRLPAGLEDFAAELGLTWWLEREYGP